MSTITAPTKDVPSKPRKSGGDELGPDHPHRR